MNRGGGEAVAYYLGCSGRPLGANRTGDTGVGPTEIEGAQPGGPAEMLEGIIFRLRSGCQWNHLPKELGDDSTIHRTFQRWVGCGALEGIWAVLIEECQELGGVNWEWQSADCSMGKARFGGRYWTQPPPTGAKPAARRASWSTQQADPSA